MPDNPRDDGVPLSILVGTGLVTLVVLALAVFILMSGGAEEVDRGPRAQSADQPAPSTADLIVAVRPTDGQGNRIAMRLRGIDVAVARMARDPKGRPYATERLSIATTDGQGRIRLAGFVPGEYMLIGPNGEERVVRVRADGATRGAMMAVCVRDCPRQVR